MPVFSFFLWLFFYLGPRAFDCYFQLYAFSVKTRLILKNILLSPGSRLWRWRTCPCPPSSAARRSVPAPRQEKKRAPPSNTWFAAEFGSVFTFRSLFYSIPSRMIPSRPISDRKKCPSKSLSRSAGWRTSTRAPRPARLPPLSTWLTRIGCSWTVPPPVCVVRWAKNQWYWCYQQCCGSGPNPGSRIPDPKTPTKERGLKKW